MRRTTAIACVLALACAVLRADAAGSAVAALGCGAGDCCYSGAANAQRYCACADAFRRSGALNACAAVRCAAGPPPGECEKLLAVPPARAAEAPDCVCTKEYAPVCVSGKTFGNACEVRRHCAPSLNAWSRNQSKGVLTRRPCLQAHCAGIQGGLTPGEC